MRLKAETGYIQRQRRRSRRFQGNHLLATGDNVYGTLKYESGVHRVQRVPATETQGRVHTSAASVAVLPEAEEFDVVINEGETEWDTFRSGGAGGQNVNKVESGVRLRYNWKNPNTGVVEENSHRMYRNARPAEEQRTRPVAPAYLYIRQRAP